MTHISAVSFQWTEAGQNGQSGLPVGQSVPTGVVVSAKPLHPGTEESTAAAAWWRAKTAPRGCVRAVSHLGKVFEQQWLLNVKRESIFGSYIFFDVMWCFSWLFNTDRHLLSLAEIVHILHLISERLRCFWGTYRVSSLTAYYCIFAASGGCWIDNSLADSDFFAHISVLQGVLHFKGILYRTVFPRCLASMARVRMM